MKSPIGVMRLTKLKKIASTLMRINKDNSKIGRIKLATNLSSDNQKLNASHGFSGGTFDSGLPRLEPNDAVVSL